MAKRLAYLLALPAYLLALTYHAPAQTNTVPAPIVLQAARLLDVETGRILAPGEVLVRGERITEVGSAVKLLMSGFSGGAGGAAVVGGGGGGGGVFFLQPEAINRSASIIRSALN